MTQAITARRDGDTFQARLLDENGPIVKVGFDTGPKSFDDIWVEYDKGKGPSDQDGVPLRREYLQCKWHSTPNTFGYSQLINPEFINAKAHSFLERAREAQVNFGELYTKVPKLGPRAASRKYEGDDGGSVLTATDADVSGIASLITNLALDALVGREPSHYAAHAYLVGHARGWMFEGPFHVQPIITDAPIRADQPPPDEDSVENEFVGKLVQRKLREIEDRSTND